MRRPARMPEAVRTPLLIVGAVLLLLYALGAQSRAAPALSQRAPEHQDAHALLVDQGADEPIPWGLALANDLGNPAPSPELLRFLDSWIQAEGTAAAYNPLATSQPMPGSSDFNSDHVQEYLSVEDGLKATVLTLQSNHPGYSNIAEGIRTNDVQRAFDGLAASPWGTHAGDVAAMIYNGGQVATLPAAAAGPAVGAKSVVTQTMAVASHFDTRDCGAWGFQVNCQHWGTDFIGAEGDPVFAPYDLTIIALGEYGPGPMWGQYVQGTFADGSVYYSGHLTGRPALEVGQTIPAGSLIGYMNGYAHTHVQLAPPGNTGPCAQDGSCLDFEQYYATH